MTVTEDFARAVRDLRWLLDRNYPQVAARELVGNRYRLGTNERAVLYRGVSSSADDARRSARRLRYDPEAHTPIWVDTLNVVYTVCAYYQGCALFVATDGWLRDAGESHGRSVPDGILERVAGHLVSHARRVTTGSRDPESIAFLIDDAADIGSDVAALLTDAGCPQVLLRPDVDRFLSEREDGVLATSDTRVIETGTCRVVDLPRYLLLRQHDPAFVELRALLYNGAE